jgi:hypothetical protein
MERSATAVPGCSALATKLSSCALLRSLSDTTTCIGCEKASGPVDTSPLRNALTFCVASATKALLTLLAGVAQTDAVAASAMDATSSLRRK